MPAALARVIATRLHESGENAETLAAATTRLGIVEPKVTHVHARALVKQDRFGDALALIDAALDTRAGSTDHAWYDLLLYRSAVLARQRWREP